MVDVIVDEEYTMMLAGSPSNKYRYFMGFLLNSSLIF